MDTAIRAANDRQVYVSGDEEAIRAYEMRELAEWEWNNSLEYARDEGIAEGEEKKQIEIARNALAKGYSLEQICDITGLDLQTIEKLK